MNPLYNMFMNQNNPMQQVMQAMQNPAAFIKSRFPDIPDNIQNDPNQIMQYLQRTRNISNNQIQQLIQQIPKY